MCWGRAPPRSRPRQRRRRTSGPDRTASDEVRVIFCSRARLGALYLAPCVSCRAAPPAPPYIPAFIRPRDFLVSLSFFFFVSVCFVPAADNEVPHKPFTVPCVGSARTPSACPCLTVLTRGRFGEGRARRGASVTRYCVDNGRASLGCKDEEIRDRSDPRHYSDAGEIYRPRECRVQHHGEHRRRCSLKATWQAIWTAYQSILRKRI